MMGRFGLLTFLLVGSALPAAAMQLTSKDLAPGGEIATAQIYPRCGGENVSPALVWSGAPPATKSFVLTMIDVDVKPSRWSHWIVVDLPPSVTSLAAGMQSLPAGAKAVASNFGDRFYDGPCPPDGTGVHHYELTIWAMPGTGTNIAPDAKASDVSAMLSARAIANATLTGWVKR
jgi:Raf kinase inhibitor-like YbhB/YbcL family protein